MPSGMTTSLISGFPRRETWTQSPESAGGAPVPESVELRSRHVEDQRLTIALGSAASVGAVWFAVRFWIGTDSAIECTLKPAVSFFPPPWSPTSVPGRKWIRSKTIPRST